MPRNRQSLNGSPTSQARGGPSKLKVSRREGFLLSLILFLGIVICAIAFYKTGDPSLPDAQGQLRRPGDQRANQLPRSLSSHSRILHPGKFFANVDLIQVQTDEDLGQDTHSTDDPAEADVTDNNSDTEIVRDESVYDDDVIEGTQGDAAEEGMPLLPLHNPYAKAQQVRSPDGIILRQHPPSPQPVLLTAHASVQRENRSVPALHTQPQEHFRHTPTSQPINSTGLDRMTQLTNKAKPKNEAQPIVAAHRDAQQPSAGDPREQTPTLNSNLHSTLTVNQSRHEQVKQDQWEQDTMNGVHQDPEQSSNYTSIDSPPIAADLQVEVPLPAQASTTLQEPAPPGHNATQNQAETQSTNTNATGHSSELQNVTANATLLGVRAQNSTEDHPADLSEEQQKVAIKRRIIERIKEHQQNVFSTQGARSYPAGMTGDELHAHQTFIQDILENGLPSDRPPVGGPSISLHPIIRVDNITTSEFEFRFASEFGLQPVVVSNSQNDWFSPERFSLQELRKLIGSKPVRAQTPACEPGKKHWDTNTCHSIKESDRGLVGVRWASLRATNLTEIGVDTYDEFLRKQIELAKEGRYIYAHEISGGWLPEIEEVIRQPKYFLNNIQDLDWGPNVDVSERVRGTHFPSIFFGASGSGSPLHSDARMTRFWIMQLAGRKLVRLVPPSENWRGDASDGRSFQPSLFTVDLMHPDYDKHPNMHNMIVYETVLEPGDILFIPEGWGHQALNLEWTWMISSNYVDEHNLPNILNFIYYEKGPGKTFREAEVQMDHFFLPMNNPVKNLTNLKLEEYFRRLTLEDAPVSDAAKHHCRLLANLNIPPSDWRDHHSKHLMTVALESNYVQLAKWLYQQGVPLENDNYGRTMLKWIMRMGMERMEVWMRTAMEVDDDDKLEDIDIDEDNSR